MRGNLLSDRLYKRVHATVKRSERAYRNTREHRRRHVTPRKSSAAIAFATLTAELTPLSSATFSFTIGAPTGETTGTCYDGGLLCSGDTLASATTVVIAQIVNDGNSQWYVIQAKCGC
ncbi:MAG TPA: hypothetical protein VFW87_09475 [Pirellulales bacterium]|nr:hypothetical protein [Pirellulales bacterium]